MNPVSFELPQDQVRKAVEARWNQFLPETLARLALLPEWTVELAMSAQLAGTEPIGNLIESLEDAGLIDKRTSRSRGSRSREIFWLRPRHRPHLARYLREKDVSFEPHLRVLNEALQTAGVKPGVGVLGYWCNVVTKYRLDPTGLMLTGDVDRLIVADQLASATKLVMAARSVGDLIRDPLDDAVKRAQWRIDRAHRIKQDERFLGTYVKRLKEEQSILDLLRPNNEQWALHLRGNGGVGKTMIIRYLASGRFAADNNLHAIPVARVDFDNLDPRYPEERPAELLLSLVSELHGYGMTRDLARQIQSFTDCAELLHEQLSRSHPDPDRVDRLRRRVARQFAEFLANLQGCVLLVIDTCEELAKLYPPGTRAPAIDETFRLLEEVHHAAPNVRVLLAGRRALNRPAEGAGDASGPVLSVRPYLAVHEIGGYTRAEADEYLDQTQPSEELRAEILRITGDENGRHNPFELNTFAGWVKAEPELSPADLRAEPSDPYVERRILSRLSRPVRDALPVAIAFGRFDLRLIKPALDRQGPDGTKVFNSLAAQEWVNVLSVGPSGQPHVIEIDEHFRPRIQRVVGSRGADPQLAEDAVDAIADTPLADVPIETVEAAINGLEPARASSWWEELEKRIVSERAWAWASQLIVRITALLDPAERGPKPSILAAILATHASARLHLGNDADLRKTWEAVQAHIPYHPSQEQQRRLSQRATLGLIACGAADPEARLEAIEDAPADAVVAAAEAILATANRLPGPLAVAVQRILAEQSPPDLRAAAGFLFAGHKLCLSQNPWDTGPNIQHALQIALEARDTAVKLLTDGEAGSYRDWIPPRRLDLRCLQAVLSIAACTNDHRLQAWSAEAWELGRKAAADVDGDRLAALALYCEMRSGEPEASKTAVDIPYRRHRGSSPAWTHRLSRRLAVAVAEALWLSGHPEEASALLHNQILGATEAGDDADMIDSCHLALLRMCRYYRTTEYLPSTEFLSGGSEILVQAEAWLVRTLVVGESPATPDDAGSLYCWVRCCETIAISAPLAVSKMEESHLPRIYLAATLRFLDRVADEPRLAADAAVHPEVLAEAMRYWVAEGRSVADRLSTRVKHRGSHEVPGLIGRAALQAGEVIALREPARALELFDLAAQHLRTVDPRGHTRAEVLAALASRRAGLKHADVEGTADEEQLRKLSLASQEWGARVRALRGKAYNRRFHSPELDWVSPRRVPAGFKRVLRNVLLFSVPRVWYNFLIMHPVVWVALQACVGFAIAGIVREEFVLVSVPMSIYLIIYLSLLRVSYPFRHSVAIRISPSDADSAEFMLRKHLGFGELHNGLLRTAPGDAWASSPEQIRLNSRTSIVLDGFELWRRGELVAPALVQLEIAREVENYPWERRLELASRSAAGESVLFRREPGRYPTASFLRWILARDSWPWRKNKPGPETDSRIDSRCSTPIAALLRGTPVETYAGYRMRTTSGFGLSPGSPSILDGEPVLIDPGQHIVVRTGLVVLMAEPIDVAAEQFGDRLSGFIAVARATLDTNAGAVLIVPPLPDKLASKVPDLVKEHLVRRSFGVLRRPRPHHLVKLLKAVKQLAGETAAGDVLLMMRTYGRNVQRPEAGESSA